MPRLPAQRDHLRKITQTQTTTKGRVDTNGRGQETATGRQRTPRDTARISDKAKTKGDDKTGGNNKTPYGTRKTKTGAGNAETPEHVEDVATGMAEDGVAIRERNTESLQDNKTGLAYPPSGSTGRATSPGNVVAATGASQHKQHSPLCP